MARRLTRGMVQVYTGSGKGKTTAAFGLALRASGAGLKVYIQQFMKKGIFSEVKAIGNIKRIKIEQCGNGCLVRGGPKPDDHRCAMAGMLRAMKVIGSGIYDVVILDEINVALDKGLLNERDVIAMLRGRPRHVEIVMTGRGCPPGIVRIADLVTEMKMVKHPYYMAVAARPGIEH